jgi:hypothetical protein
MKKKIVVSMMALVFVSATAFVAFQQNVKTEAIEHPRIVLAIKQLQDAIDYLEKAPDTFGGFKAQAINDSKKAVESLKRALNYKARVDNKAKK